MFRATDCAFAAWHNFDIYRPSKNGNNCPPPLTTATLIKSLWTCGDGGALEIGSTVNVSTLNECESLCKEEPLCVWF